MMTGWRDCHQNASEKPRPLGRGAVNLQLKVSIFSGSLSTMTRSSGINARAFNFGRQKSPGRNY
ncbi:TPA: hypothetical protein ACGTFM_002836, partial [Salmonella enterica]